jgi:hypothetical protein
MSYGKSHHVTFSFALLIPFSLRRNILIPLSSKILNFDTWNSHGAECEDESCLGYDSV